MASKKAQLQRIENGGVIGSVQCGLYMLVTNDAEAAIETDAYLDDDAERFPEGASSILLVIADRDGTPAFLAYGVTRTAGDIALTPVKGTS